MEVPATSKASVNDNIGAMDDLSLHSDPRSKSEGTSEVFVNDRHG